MSITLEVYNEILHLSLRPWQVQYHDNKYTQLLNETKAETYQFQPLYKINFQKPVSLKRQYYHRIISNVAIQCLNELNNSVETAFNEEAKKYLISKKFFESLKSKIADLKKIIELKQFFITSFTATSEDAYIFQFLKYNVIRLYLEVQNTYPDFWSEEPLTEQEILENLFTDPHLDKDLIKPETERLVPDRKKSTLPKKAPSPFKPLNYEIREYDEKVITYGEIVAKPEKLGEIEKILVELGYLDKDLTFVRGDGNKLVIAAVAHILKQKNYFKTIAFHNNKKVKVDHLQIQRFISHRYMKNFDQEYRDFKQDINLQPYLNDHLWIKKLPF